MTAIFFVNVCKELKTTQINQVNELFQFKITCIQGDAFYGLFRMPVSKNVNNDISKDSL